VTTPENFRRIALGLPEAAESSHMDHPDFRVGGKIFATLGYPDENCGMVKLQPEQQENFSRDYPGAFAAVKGGWGRRGATQVRLENVDKATLRRAITAAYRNVASKKPGSRKA
jgi:hypothetical protein